ncbi:hypothetical protein LX32DRAFT_165163 [Colletotrichum zoysiae]|uniref:Uncharacterized protein n=1 Tax=Colletotrichum zoysiae TaxID=1216348 RepID=A0AAD9H7P1_9PEZI|nr:hypothetical protein LX32DRAFT_165163 [Colletotrichum zoysiae]
MLVSGQWTVDWMGTLSVVTRLRSGLKFPPARPPNHYCPAVPTVHINSDLSRRFAGDEVRCSKTLEFRYPRVFASPCDCGTRPLGWTTMYSRSDMTTSRQRTYPEDRTPSLTICTYIGR